MKRKVSKTRAGVSVLLAALCTCLSPQTIKAEYYNVNPVINAEATRGLSTVGSAEAMGEGRLTFNVSGNWYNQNTAFAMTPNQNANIIAGRGAVSYGASPFIDLFGSVSAFGSSRYTNASKTGGWGSVKAGVQGTLPYSKEAIMHLGAQAALIGGTSENQINTYRSDGFDYFQTRTTTDFMGKILESFSFGSEEQGIKLHLNEGAVTSLNGSNKPLLLTGAALQGDIASFMAIGVELNSRTQLDDWAFATDPLWITPTVQFRSSYNTNVSAGVDIALSGDRSGGQPNALAPYRLSAPWPSLSTGSLRNGEPMFFRNSAPFRWSGRTGCS